MPITIILLIQRIVRLVVFVGIGRKGKGKEAVPLGVRISLKRDKNHQIVLWIA